MIKLKLFLFLLTIIAIIYLTFRHVANAKALLKSWAVQNRLQVLQIKQSFWVPPSLYYASSKLQVIYRVSFYDETCHRIRNAWVRLGTRYLGVMSSDAVEVIWDEAG